MTDDVVARQLRRWAKTAFAWGHMDCALAIADYVHEVTGRDGAADLRGRYGSRDEAERDCGLSFGLLPVVARCAAVVGLVRTDAPMRGDIGVLKLRHVEMAGLFLGHRWAIKSPEGVIYLDRVAVIASWSVPA